MRTTTLLVYACQSARAITVPDFVIALWTAQDQTVMLDTLASFAPDTSE
jgi:hypothetical protein